MIAASTQACASRYVPGGLTFPVDPPILFTHYPNFKLLPNPEAGGSLNEPENLAESLAHALKRCRGRVYSKRSNQERAMK